MLALEIISLKLSLLPATLSGLAVLSSYRQYSLTSFYGDPIRAAQIQTGCHLDRQQPVTNHRYQRLVAQKRYYLLIPASVGAPNARSIKPFGIPTVYGTY